MFLTDTSEDIDAYFRYIAPKKNMFFFEVDTPTGHPNTAGWSLTSVCGQVKGLQSVGATKGLLFITESYQQIEITEHPASNVEQLLGFSSHVTQF